MALRKIRRFSSIHALPFGNCEHTGDGWKEREERRENASGENGEGEHEDVCVKVAEAEAEAVASEETVEGTVE